MNLTSYDIEIRDLSNGIHQYEWDSGPGLFQDFNNSDVADARLHTEIKLEKQDEDLTLHLLSKGFLEIPCDRCLDLYKQEIDAHMDLQVKLSVQTDYEAGEDLVYIDRESGILNIAGFIYEAAMLDLPLKKTHPDTDDCNKEVTKYIDGETDISEIPGNNQEEQISESEPIWKKLNDLNN